MSPKILSKKYNTGWIVEFNQVLTHKETRMAMKNSIMFFDVWSAIKESISCGERGAVEVVLTTAVKSHIAGYILEHKDNTAVNKAIKCLMQIDFLRKKEGCKDVYTVNPVIVYTGSIGGRLMAIYDYYTTDMAVGSPVYKKYATLYKGGIEGYLKAVEDAVTGVALATGMVNKYTTLDDIKDL